MTPQEVIDLKKVIVGIAAYYQKSLPDEVIRMYANDLKDLNFTEVLRAYETWRKDPKSRFMPLPADIRSLVNPSSQPDELIAREAISRLMGAIPKHGHTNPKEAEAYMGELAWEVVKIVGGWYHVSTQMGVSLNSNTCSAHWKDLALGLIQKARLGTLDVKPALPRPNDQGASKVNSLVSTAIKHKEIPK